MKKFVKAVLLTTILSVATRALGLFIKIYISRVIGAEALGYYQIALSVFFLLCTLVTSGIPLIISRMIAKHPDKESKVVFAGLILSTAISFVVCIFIVLFPQLLVGFWGQINSLGVLFYLLPAVIFTAIYVPFRGAFWGEKDFFMLGFTELIEQVFRFVSCLILFNVTLSISGAEIAGVTYSIACGLSSLFAIAIYFFKGRKIRPNIKLIKPLFLESAPIAVMRIGSSVVSLLISIILPLIMVKNGYSQADAISAFGVVTGMVMPLLTISGTLISSISVALIPELSSVNEKRVQRQINQAISYSIIISFLLLPTFMVLGKPIGKLLFNDSLAGEILSIGSIILLPLGLSQITSSILNAINKEKFSLFSYTIGAVAMVISIIILPKYIGIYSLVAGFFFMSVISTLLNLLAIKKYLVFDSLKTLFFSIIYSIPSALLGRWAYSIVCHFAPEIISIIIACGLSVGTLVLLYQIFKFIDIKDYMPKKFLSHA